MDILVYGAGVIGCELAHMLCKGGGRVTLLARGAWRDAIRRDGLVSEEYYRPGPKRRRMAATLYLMAKTPLGQLAASDHAMRAVGEMRALDEAFEDLRRRAGTPMPVWDSLRAGIPDWDTLSRTAAL